ncbi:TraR/DksA family transcriptional regulator [Pseudonocardia bannensis]|uniref:TraR/DksA family transcriptional regulator n=1 Tax=Pseudonocardia bannensis TaxID=630973 RepID=A0A848DE79_9PSEU|nr:TraR/DksA C4-type zinc finger protein [Pseudonocardia bannensis]NMH90871.1 TraR/DksA family transcriptional regulator [Pseudonocardia bannensis]
MDPDRARRLLTAELSDLDARASFARREEEQVQDDPVLGTHPGDHGSEVATRMDSHLLSDTIGEQRRRVLEALERLDDGTYGRCMVCDREIDDERLEIRPEVRTCREHADQDPHGAT